MSEEPKYQEVIHSVKYVEEPAEDVEVDTSFDNIDLDNPQDIANYYMTKSGQLDPSQIEVEKKEKELREDIKQVVENKEELIDYLTNLHASIEVMEERIYELELQAAKKERQSVESIRRSQSPGGRGLSQLPIGLF